ncbi:MAG: PIN domain-containing protein [Actinomycetota bacterium]|nr:PIN domain-containing protein [Actinomycetota bacterium]
MTFTALCDANVLHPASLRDLLIRLGATGLFRARWTERILDETIESILRRRPDLDAERLARTRALICGAVADCLVVGYEPLIEALKLPDPDDRHVLAAAIRCSAQVIVTSNLKDFPASALEPFNIEAQTPDVFVLHLVELAPERVAAVVQQQASALKSPEVTVDELLDRLSTRGLPLSVAALRADLGA